MGLQQPERAAWTTCLPFLSKDEIDRTLAQLGCPTVAGLSRDYLTLPVPPNTSPSKLTV
jgi:hypothetical protein